MPVRRRQRARCLLLAAAASLVAAAPAQAAGERAPQGKARAAQTACTASAVEPSEQNVARLRSSVLCLLNRERTRRGLRRLRSDDRLQGAATGHSRDMVRRDFFSHESPGGGTMTERIKASGYLAGARGYSFAENIAWGTGDYATPAEIVDSWMTSPGHRRNILHGPFTDIGIGIALGAPDRGPGGATYTTNFGVRR